MMAQTETSRISLLDYEGKESKEAMFFGRSVAISAGDRLTVPIPITAPRSLVEYAIEVPSSDLGVAITAERGRAKTIVKTAFRLDAKNGPTTHKFLVGTAPCVVNFLFDNDFSMMRKAVSYTVTVKPPVASSESAASGRRSRAKACLKAVDEDLNLSRNRLTKVTIQKEELQRDVARIKKELNEMKLKLRDATDETASLVERTSLRNEQRSALMKSLEQDAGEEGVCDDDEIMELDNSVENKPPKENVIDMKTVTPQMVWKNWD